MHKRLRNLLVAAALAAAPLLSGCIGLAPTETPIPSIETADEDSRNRSLVIMLPGRGDRGDVFIREGFHNAGRQFGFDTSAVDAHFGYYMQRSLLERLHEDIVMPARAAGYENVWLLGVSMGGLGSLLYAAEHPAQVDGVILLAPFLGDRSAIKTIVESGPLESWNGEGKELKDYEIAIWKYIRDATRGAEPTPLILANGLSDRMADGYEKLLDFIRPSSVYTLEGGHKWTTWKPLWEQIAADLDL
jgi:pimeloyl-ACP methyl ester carboxylesterase